MNAYYTSTITCGHVIQEDRALVLLQLFRWKFAHHTVSKFLPLCWKNIFLLWKEKSRPCKNSFCRQKTFFCQPVAKNHNHTVEIVLQLLRQVRNVVLKFVFKNSFCRQKTFSFQPVDKKIIIIQSQLFYNC